jgi:hypothetical protein
MREDFLFSSFSTFKRDVVTGEWRKLHNEELNSLPNIVWVVKSRRMKCGEFLD